MSYTLPSNQEAYDNYMMNQNLSTGVNIANNLGASGSLGFFLGNILGGTLGDYLFNKNQNKIDNLLKPEYDLAKDFSGGVFNNLPKSRLQYPQANLFNESGSVFQKQKPAPSISDPNYLSDQFAKQVSPPSSYNLANEFPYLSIGRR